MTTPISVDGLISGLKTNDIIQQMIALEQAPLDALTRKRTTEQQRADAVRDITNRLASLHATLANLKLRSTVNAKSANSSGSAIAASTSADAANGVYRVSVTQLATPTRAESTAAAGQAIDRNAALTAAGFSLMPMGGVFRINGSAITVADPSVTRVDDGAPGSLLDLINSAGAGVTASLVADSDGRLNRLQLVSAPGSTIQLGAGADTSNLLSALKLSGAQVTGHTAANVDGTPIAAGALTASFTVNGKQVAVTTGGGNSAQDNAAAVQQAISAAGAGVTVVVNGDNSLSIVASTAGSGGVIDLAGDLSGTGLSVGVTRNGADRVVSTGNLGTVSPITALGSGSARLTAPLAGLDGDGSGSFTINGVSIAYNGSESLNTVLSRINASNAGVTAAYDALLDRVTLSARATGAALISLADVQGNFLTATGLAGAAQQTGQNAVYTIDGVNGGQPLSSSSNSISGVLNGVTLDLKDITASPVTLTVSQNVDATASALKAFVDQYNSAIDLIRRHASFDATLKQAGLLMADSGVRGIEAQLRRLISTPATGTTGAVRSLADLGVSTGKVGSAIGATNTLTFDTAKLSAVLKDNPNAVESVLNAFSSTAALSGTGPVASLSGVPGGHHEAGYYEVSSLDGSGVTVTFFPNSGSSGAVQNGTLGVASTSTSLIAGMTLTGSGTAGTSIISINVQERGIVHTLYDYLAGLTGSGGMLRARADQSAQTLTALDRQSSRLQERLTEKESRLRARFSVLEQTLARLQSQSNQLAAQVANLSAQAASQS